MTRTADRRLAELALHVAGRSEGDRFFGATKLNKILFYADFAAYARHGASITGAAYQRLEFGPAPRRIVPVVKALKDAGRLVEHEVHFRGFPQRRLYALADADLSLFSADDIAVVDSVIEELRPLSASDVSHLSHQFAGWHEAEPGATIPYEMVFSVEPRLPVTLFDQVALPQA